MVFLVISAFLFAVGLMLFAFLSQVCNRYFSSILSINQFHWKTASIAIVTAIFTGLHVFGLGYLTLWFFIETKYTSKIAMSLVDRHRRLLLRILQWKRCIHWCATYLHFLCAHVNIILGHSALISWS